LAHVHLTAFLTLSPKAYIPSHRLPPKTCTKNAVFMTRLLYFNQTMIIHDATKRLQELAANIQPQTMDSWKQ
jgi:hypothetical protein